MNFKQDIRHPTPTVDGRNPAALGFYIHTSIFSVAWGFNPVGRPKDSLKLRVPPAIMTTNDIRHDWMS